ncbi:hydantoinase/oxoprolinase family protein [Methanosphaerula palustris]|uniref:H4MPT-linked C1 transfer pathway protein n=1 Tax=Methanosphaerula palustris (strain ATCC BAA-1556 / DSM 19958 / E1-9c) TaxID=521011 RepID=B8GFA3_METPE|nr:hydantoinase/oxoprolinase family protein [Methanosphaerula palustris]ACL15951.1 H4MPT-linked C1 transfer pathway protein [Methanosphaerula palustris E1-9c]
MIGIDVGGANLKVVTEKGVAIHYCPLWEKAPITTLLRPYNPGLTEEAAVVMSGELADCFPAKEQGIRFIVNAVRAAFPQSRFYGMDGAFHDDSDPSLAAANWLASADRLRREHPNALFVDFGSTTTDIIPLTRFSDLTGLTDLLRLQRGYLIYTGMLRTNVAAILHSVDLEGVRTPISSEYFATSADLHLVLGHITTEQYTCDAPDHREKTLVGSQRRLARVVCADLEEIGEVGVLSIAEQCWAIQSHAIRREVERIAEVSGADEVLTAGIGAGLIAGVLGGTSLEEELGELADALPAWAVREMALQNRSH